MHPMVDASSLVIVPASRRTRKRFTNVQLTMLENLFHQNSHPSRQDREALARAGAMEIKSVTIWFQNKRQTERKSAASNGANANSFNEHNVHPNITSTIHTFSLHSTDSLPSPPLIPSRPSLDRVASRSELRTPSSHNRPHSPRRLASFPPTNPPSSHHQRQLYDHLPSSPLYPPTSPPTPLARDFLEFGKSSNNAKTRRTLEWACEAARIADKDKERDRDKDRESALPCCTSPAIHGNHRHHPHHAHQIPHQQLYASTEPFTTSTTTTPSTRGRPVQHQRGAKDHHQLRQSHRKEPARESARDRLTRPSSSLTLRGEGSLSSLSSSTRAYTPRGFQHQGDMTDSEVEEDHEAITPPTPSITNRWSARLTKTSTNTSLTSSSSTSTTPSTSASISREGSNASFTSISSAPMQVEEDDAMFKAAIALCGLGRMGQVQNSMQRRA